MEKEVGVDVYKELKEIETGLLGSASISIILYRIVSQVAIWLSLFRRKPNEGIPRHLFYNYIDTLEDKVLLSKEYIYKNIYITVGKSANRLENFEKSKKFDTMRITSFSRRPGAPR